MHLDKQLVLSHSAGPITDDRKFSRYIRIVGVNTALGAFLTLLFVIIIDPYHLFRIVDIPGFNRIKPVPERYREQIKVAQARTVQPNLMLLGNSRIEVGIDPETPQLKARSYSSYNLALAGTSLVVAEKVFNQVRSAGPAPAISIVGLDFLDFLVNPRRDKPVERLANADSDAWKWRFDTLFSLKSIADSLRTLRLQNVSDPETMTTRGHTPLFEYNKLARQEGYHAIFRQRGQENAKAMVRRPRSLYSADGSSPNLESLRRMLASMAKDRTETHLIIYPYHAELMAMVEEVGLQPVMEEWKSLLIREIETVRSQYPSARIALWDFSGYGPVQCESIPLSSDTRSVTRFYWEAGHFKSSVGELILERVLGKETDFGTALTMANLSRNRERIAAELAQCKSTNPKVFADVASMIGAAKKIVAR